MTNALARRVAQGFGLHGLVGNGRDNNPDDVMAVKRRLARHGRYAMPDDGPSEFIDRAMLDGITAFQRDHGLKVDGWLAPGGETEEALRDVVARRGEPLNPRNLPYDPTEPAYVRTMEIRPDDPPAKPVLLADGGDVSPAAWGQSLLADDEAETDKPVQVAMAPVLAAPALGAAVTRVAPIIGKEVLKRAAPYLPSAVTGAIAGKEAADNNDVVGRYITDLFNETRPMTSDRGDEPAVTGNDQVVRTCLAQLKTNYPDVAEHIEHVGGATRDGGGDKKLKEMYLPDAAAKAEGRDGRKGSSNMDISFRDNNKGEKEPGPLRTSTPRP